MEWRTQTLNGYLGAKGSRRESEYGGKRNSPNDIDIVLKNNGFFSKPGVAPLKKIEGSSKVC